MRLSLLFFTFLLAGNDLLLGRGAPLTKASAPVSKTAAHVLRVHSKLSGKVMEVLIQSETLAEAASVLPSSTSEVSSIVLPQLIILWLHM